MDFRGKNIDLVGKWKLWFAISIAIIVIGVGAWRAFGLNYGIDFKGGGQLQYRIPQAARPAGGQEAGLINNVREGLDQRQLRGPKIQVAGGDTLVIQTDARDDAELRGQERRINEVLAGQFKVPASSPYLQPIGRQLVGPVIGEELRVNAIKGVLLGVGLIALWIYIRYNFAGDGTRYAVAALVALLHDVLVLLGIFAIIGRFDPRVEVDGSFIAALLTVVGYSINDSVVIFDRTRENLRQRRKEPFNKIINDSLLETMSRSINTGLTVVIMLLVLVMMGGESIYNFTLAMLIGIISGLYSSIFNASMVLVAWHVWDEKRKLTTRSPRPVGRSSTSGAGRTSNTPAPRAGTAGASAAPRGGLAAAGLASGTISGTVAPTSAPSSTSASTAPATTGVFVDDTPRVAEAVGAQGSGDVSLSKSAVDETSEEEGTDSGEDNGEVIEQIVVDGRTPARVIRSSQKARAKRRH